MQLSTKKGHTKSVQERQGASESLECLKVVTGKKHYKGFYFSCQWRDMNITMGVIHKI
jgi:hypothetical protein